MKLTRIRSDAQEKPKPNLTVKIKRIGPVPLKNNPDLEKNVKINKILISSHDVQTKSEYGSRSFSKNVSESDQHIPDPQPWLYGCFRFNC